MGEQQIMKENTKKKINWVYVVFALMIAVQLGSIIYYFQFKKEGWHSDEIWSYGYANSYYLKDIYQDNDGNPINRYEWVSGDVLRDYIVVNDGERFEYGSIYQNQIKDLSPPLHSMVLHTICSFFPEQFSFWYSFVINIAAFLVCMIFLFKTTRLLKGDWFALCCCAVYGFSVAARDTYIYLRMYAMCTAMVMIILYNLLVYMKRTEGKTIFNRNLVAITITGFLGFLTHYYMIAFMGILTFLVCVYYLFRKRIKQMFVFGLCQLGSLLMSFAVFPVMFSMTQSQTSTVTSNTNEMMNYNFEIRFRILSNFLTMKLFGVPVSIYRSGILPIFFGCLVALLIWIIPLIFLLRKTKLVKQIFKRVRFFIGHLKQIGRWIQRRINWYYIILVIIIPCQMIVVGETSKLAGMGQYEDRYLMYIYPIVVIVGLVLLYQGVIILLKKRKYGKMLLGAVSIVLIIVNVYNCWYFTDYFFDRMEEGQRLESCVEDKACIYIESTQWLLTAMDPILMNADQFFMCSPEDYANYIEDYKDKCSREKVLIILDTSFFKTELSGYNEMDGYNIKDDKQEVLKRLYDELIQSFEDLEPDTKMEKTAVSTIFGRTMEVYTINP